MIIDIQFEQRCILDAALELKNKELLVDFGDISLVDAEAIYYDGPYVVTPKVTSQVLQTEDKRMTADVTVKEIPYYEVSNLAKGKTIIIGG